MPKDLSLKKLKVIYECQDKGEINEYFDKEIRELGKKYGIKWQGQGMEIKTGIRDISFVSFRPRCPKCNKVLTKRAFLKSE